MGSESRPQSPTHPTGKTAAGHDHGVSVHDLDKKAEWGGDQKASMAASQGKGRRQQQPGIDTALDRWRLVAIIIMVIPIVWALAVALAGRGAAGVGIPFDSFRFLGGLGGVSYRANTCQAATFSALLPANAVVENVTSVPEGGSFGEGADNLPSPTNPTGLPQLCAVIIKVVSSPSSSFRFGMFLPTAPGKWNGRFLAVGNGGFGGGISWRQMAESGPHHGFATLSTDTGHNSTALQAEWALHKPESRTDWGWRALHESVTMGKKLTRAFYGRHRRRRMYSYYSSCSTGGRQGLKEIQISPGSFDGVLVGAPAWWTSHLNTFAAKTGTYNLPFDAPHHVPVELFAAISREAVRQCDGDDGVVDGIISAPDECGFNLGAMRCGNPGVNSSACLTDAQIQTVRNIYDDWRREGSAAKHATTTTYSGGPAPPVKAASAPAVLGADEDLLYPGLNPGSEQGWHVLFNGTEPSPFGMGYIRNFVLDDPDWDWRAFNDSILDLAARTDPGGPTADTYDITPFRRRGGKVLLYHGTADGLVPLRGTHLYYERTRQAMGTKKKTGGDDDDGLSDFFRYFLVPGMGHCAGTPTAWSFGAAGQASALNASAWSVPGFNNERHDALLALVGWVEEGRAVDQIVATTWNDDEDASSGVSRQRPLCPFPKRAIWDKVGEVHEASSWRCE
ncbi:feruloyl esterase B [Magnaporthiopsis poae ATCC 64411]|uniref:Carboxylic ester hydrolase n=1 Tax=Magnaporthiopsis poae (strain ATCC 64411 / 73-15) TaxID=644358 RepID=A0A0C4DKE5_MAGP6|nr:feruloyl esterase B [Magnaporthiopsis poae ATCC 64411]